MISFIYITPTFFTPYLWFSIHRFIFSSRARNSCQDFPGANVCDRRSWTVACVVLRRQYSPLTPHPIAGCLSATAAMTKLNGNQHSPIAADDSASSGNGLIILARWSDPPNSGTQESRLPSSPHPESSLRTATSIASILFTLSLRMNNTIAPSH